MVGSIICELILSFSKQSEFEFYDQTNLPSLFLRLLIAFSGPTSPLRIEKYEAGNLFPVFATCLTLKK